MKVCFLITLCIACSFLFIQSKDPSAKKPEPDSLDYFLTKDDLVSYFKKVEALADSAQKHNRLEALRLLGEKLLTPFRNLSDKEKMALRNSAMYLGSYIERKLGDYNFALQVYLVAHAHVIDTIFLDHNSWYVENRIINNYTRLGDYEKADAFAELTERSLLHFKKYEFLSRLYTNWGINLDSRKQPDQAIVLFNKGLAIADSLHYYPGIFSNHLNLADMYSNGGQPDLARVHLLGAEEVLDSLQKEKNIWERISSLEITKADLSRFSGQYSESIAHYREALKAGMAFYTGSKSRELAKIYTPLAEVYLLMDSVAEAETAIHKGLTSLLPNYVDHTTLPPLSELYRENSFINLFALKAETLQRHFEKTGDTLYISQALASIDLSLDASDLIRNALIMEPSKLISLSDHKPLVNKGIELANTLYSQGNQDIYFQKARALFTRSKGLLLNEKMKRNFIAKKLTTAERKELETLEEKILDLHTRKFEPEADPLKINSEILQLKSRIDLLLEGYKGYQAKRAVFSDYIEYCVTADDVFAMASIEGKNRFLKLGKSGQLDTLLQQMNVYISLRDEGKGEEVLRKLDQFLMVPVVQSLPGRLVIIPDGVLSLVPFEILKDEHNKYRVERTTISYAFQYEPFIPDKIKRSNKTEIFCLAPEYREAAKTGHGIERGSLYHLPYVQWELDSIQHLFRKKAKISRSGEKEKWFGEIRQAGIFHFAGHAIVQKEFAFLALKDTNQLKYQLTDVEISEMHNPMELVVLSACETGLGKYDSGEGVRSLGRSFMEAGAGAAVYSLWNVNDRSTAAFMHSFYTYLKTGKRKDEALRQCKLDFLHHPDEAFHHPYYWAAFVGAGEMGVLEAGSAWLNPGIILLSGLLIILAFLVLRNRPSNSILKT